MHRPSRNGNSIFSCWIRLGNSSFHGSIPIELAKLNRFKPMMISFSFHDCDHWGDPTMVRVDPSFMNCFTGYMDFSANNLINGSVPEVTGNLLSLKESNLASNQLPGFAAPGIVNRQTIW
ncbi:hypothetical protein OIU85_023114 [Salix viminalis]|uniref:Uncharacterized protein n=1 Tax=Salix viminalis TaxID=40686 RepID=A0A9Q0Z8I7_SALVM|nr:hypothetical protein OIU85_023114 [Salix viminalis]